MSCRVVHHVTSHHIIYIIPYHITSYTISYTISYHISCHVMSNHRMSCHIIVLYHIICPFIWLSYIILCYVLFISFVLFIKLYHLFLYHVIYNITYNHIYHISYHIMLLNFVLFITLYHLFNIMYIISYYIIHPWKKVLAKIFQTYFSKCQTLSGFLKNCQYDVYIPGNMSGKNEWKWPYSLWTIELKPTQLWPPQKSTFCDQSVWLRHGEEYHHQPSDGKSLGWKQRGLQYRTLPKEMQMSQRIVYSILRRHRENPGNVKDRPRSGRRRATTSRGGMALVRLARQQRNARSASLAFPQPRLKSNWTCMGLHQTTSERNGPACTITGRAARSDPWGVASYATAVCQRSDSQYVEESGKSYCGRWWLHTLLTVIVLSLLSFCLFICHYVISLWFIGFYPCLFTQINKLIAEDSYCSYRFSLHFLLDCLRYSASCTKSGNLWTLRFGTLEKSHSTPFLSNFVENSQTPILPHCQFWWWNSMCNMGCNMHLHEKYQLQ